MDYGVYRTAHGAFPEEIAGEFTAVVLPPAAALVELAPCIKNALVLAIPDALHLLHWNRIFELLTDKQYRSGRISGIVGGEVNASLSNDCAYCADLSRSLTRRCDPCRPELMDRYRSLVFDVPALLRYLDWAGGRKLMPVLLHKDETFVRLRSDDIADGRLRNWGDDLQGYNPLSLTFDWKIIRRNELIFNAEMAERTGRMKAMKFEPE